MRQIIKEDILDVLKKIIKALNEQDYSQITELSNHTIHDASIFQEDDPLTLAVLLYALSKYIQRCIERNKPVPEMTEKLTNAIEALENDDDNEYRVIIKELLSDISKMDEQMKLYIQQVIQQSRIKKASKIHEHGISIARTAELLGLSQWELQNYIGKTTIEAPHNGPTIKDRLRKTRELFE